MICRYVYFLTVSIQENTFSTENGDMYGIIIHYFHHTAACSKKRIITCIKPIIVFSSKRLTSSARFSRFLLMP